MKSFIKYLLVYLIGCAFMFSTIFGYINAKNSQKKELPAITQSNSIEK